MQRAFPWLRPIFAAAILSLAAACGSGDGAPHNSGVTFSPAEVDQLTQAGPPPYGFNIQYVKVTLLTGGGQPLPNTGFLVSAATGWGVEIYEGELTLNELAVATPITVPATLTTGEFGSKMLTVLYPVLPAEGTFTMMEAWSGTAYQKWDVNYSCEDPDENDAFECPGGAS